MGYLAILAAISAGILLTSVGESRGQQCPGIWERALIGPPLGIAAWGLATSALWTVFGPSDGLSLLGLVCLLGLGVLCWARGPRVLQGRPPTGAQVARWMAIPALAVMLLIGIRHLTTADGLLLQGDPMTDLPFHMALAGILAEASSVPIDHPLMSGLPLRYHVVADVVAAAAVRLNSASAGFAAMGSPEAFSLEDLVAVFNVLDMVLAASLAGLVGLLAFRHGLSPAASHLAVWLFLLGGGLGFAFYWPDLLRDPGQALASMHSPPDRLHDWGIVWTGMLRDFVVHARATLLGLCLGVAALVRFTAGRRLELGDAVGAGLCAGLLPFSQVHSFIGTMLCLGALWLLGRRSGSRPFWLTVLALVALQLPALLAMRQGMVAIQPGWESPRHDALGLLQFWALNLGVLFFVPPLVAWRPGGDLRRLWLASLLPFALCNVLVFTVPWNNIKILHSWFLVACILTAAGLGELWNTSRLLPRLLALGLALLSVATGLVSLAWHSGTHAVIPRPMLEYALQARRSVPRDQAIATFPDVALLLPSYSFRRVYLAQSGLSVSHGVHPGERIEAIRRLYSAASLEDLVSQARKMGVAFVELQAHDPGFLVNRPLIESLPLEVDGGDQRLYRIPPDAVEARESPSRAGGQVHPPSGKT